MGDPLTISLIANFEHQVEANPRAIALTIEDGRAYTYAELNDLATEIAKHVAATIDSLSIDMGENDTPLVSVMMNRDVGIIASILAILKAGAAYVPVDPAFPPDRQSYIFKHSRCHLAILDEECMDKAHELGVELPPTVIVSCRSAVPVAVKVMHVDDSSLESKRASALTRINGGLGYVLYTSGSTGNPKGVMVKQQGVVNIINWFATQLGTSLGKKVLCLTTFCFDISVLEMFMPLLHGANLVLAFSSTQKDPFRLLEIVEENRIDVLQATPTTFEMMLATGWNGDPLLDLLVGGEAFRPTLLPMVALSRSVRNVYGPTETTIWSSSYTIPRDIASTTHAGPTPPPISIGAPISQTDFYLASEADVTKLSLPNEEGELCIGGVGVARGYLHAPELTQGRFISCPYPGGSGSVYRTGDIVKRADNSDNYVFVRRMDDQVKIDGFRIELAEIEQVYLQHALVEQAVALVRNGRLVIYIKASQGSSLTEAVQEEIRVAASLKLTYYMMPKDTVIVDEFPQTANGKLDRKALPDPPTPGETQKISIDLSKEVVEVEAALPVAKTMVDHVCNVFQVVRGKRPNPNASFAAMGVDSLGAVLFIRYLSESVGGAKIKPADVYSAGVTIRSFALVLHERLARENKVALENLGISVKIDSRINALDVTLNGDSGLDEVSGDPATNAFEELVASNTSLFEGLRGLFAFMVLYDHFHDTSNPLGYSLAINSDVSLFVILTGFTTALQLRDAVPRYSDLPLRSRRAEFNWKNFLTTRAVGIFPILWFAILLCAPRWVLQSQGGTAFMVQERRRLDVAVDSALTGECAFLYVIGMQLWDVRCRRVGPDDLAYACIIWNCFIMYSVVRWVLRLVQDFLLHSPGSTISCCSIRVRDSGLNVDRGAEMVGDEYIILEEGRGKLENRQAASHQLPRFIDLAVFNRLPSDYAFAVSTFWILLHFGLFNVLWLVSSQAKNPITFIAYFTSGVAVASVWENWHWCQQSVKFSESVEHAQALLIRFGADAVFVVCIFLCSPFRATQSGEARSFGNFLKWAGIPILTVIFLPLVCMQKPGVERRNLSRFLLENPLAKTLGYVSYTLYLFQHVALEFYGHIIAENAANGRSYPQSAQEYGALYLQQWYHLQPPGLQTCGILTLICFCWLVQYFFQDVFVAGLYANILKINSQRRTTEGEGGDGTLSNVSYSLLPCHLS